MIAPPFVVTFPAATVSASTSVTVRLSLNPETLAVIEDTFDFTFDVFCATIFSEVPLTWPIDEFNVTLPRVAFSVTLLEALTGATPVMLPDCVTTLINPLFVRRPRLVAEPIWSPLTSVIESAPVPVTSASIASMAVRTLMPVTAVSDTLALVPAPLLTERVPPVEVIEPARAVRTTGALTAERVEPMKMLLAASSVSEELSAGDRAALMVMLPEVVVIETAPPTESVPFCSRKSLLLTIVRSLFVEPAT